MVSVSDSQSGGPEFESHSDRFLDLFLGGPEFMAMLVNNQLVFLRSVGILSNVTFSLIHLFQLLTGLH